MQDFAKYTVNAGMEIVMLIVISLLLISCILQKNKNVTTRPLIQLIIVNMMLLVCQIAEWLLIRQQCLTVVPNSMLIKQVLYSLDYSLAYAMTLCFFRYITIYVADLSGNIKHYEEKSLKQTRFLFIFGIIISILFTYLMFRGDFFFVDSFNYESYSEPWYSFSYYLASVATLSSVIVLLKNHKLLQNKGYIILMSYIVTPYIVVMIDIKSDYCVSYLIASFFTLVLYLGIDIRVGRAMLEQSAKMTELRTEMMLSQIQPHFLYNTLTTISALCYFGNSEQAKEVVDKLSDYLRKNLESISKSKLIPFEEELEHVKTYLWIEQVRFGDTLKVAYEINEKDFTLPALTLQPIVENAVKHGIKKKKGGGTVKIVTSSDEGNYIVSIIDDGAGFDVNAKPKDDKRIHVGINNITERFEILCHAHLEFISEIGKGTTVNIYIPKKGE